MILRLMRKFIVSTILTLLLLAYVASYGFLRLTDRLVLIRPIPLVQNEHRIEAAQPKPQDVLTDALKSTTRLSDLTRIADTVQKSYQKQERQGQWMETLYWPLRKIEAALRDSGN